MLKKADLSVSRNIHGAIEISALVNGYYRTISYYFYSKSEAIKKFLHDYNQ
jgi:hypothetical protein